LPNVLFIDWRIHLGNSAAPLPPDFDSVDASVLVVVLWDKLDVGFSRALLPPLPERHTTKKPGECSHKHRA
jgi:hypothetical protein